MVDIVVDVRGLLSVSKLDEGLSFLLNPGIAEVDEMPSNMLTIVRNILRVVPVAVSNHVIYKLITHSNHCKYRSGNARFRFRLFLPTLKAFFLPKLAHS